MTLIDRSMWNALVDDDGTGQVGTPWTKDQIKVVLLDPTDGAITRIVGVDGSPATPTYGFASEAGLGIYRAAASQIGLTVSSTLAFIWGATAQFMASSCQLIWTSGSTPAAGSFDVRLFRAAAHMLAMDDCAGGPAQLRVARVVSPIVSLTDGATPAVDASLGAVFRLAASGDRTIAVPTNAGDGQKIVIQHFANAAARTLSLNTGVGGFRFGSDVTGLTQTVSGKTDYIGCLYNTTDNKWDVIAYSKGY